MKQKLDKLSILRWMPAVVWSIIICWLSFTALDKLAIPSFSGADKVGHIGMYFILSYFIYFGSKPNFKRFQLIILVAVLLAIATELIQHYYVINRVGDTYDFIANFIGISIIYVWKKRTQDLTKS